MAGLVGVLGVLLVIVLVLAARFAADRDPLERALACGTLAVEALLVRHGLVVLGLLGLPAACRWPSWRPPCRCSWLGIVACWPRREAPSPELGYNGGHG